MKTIAKLFLANVLCFSLLTINLEILNAKDEMSYITLEESDDQVLVGEENLSEVEIQKQVDNALREKYIETRGYSYRYVTVGTKQTEYSLGYLAFGQDDFTNFTTPGSGFYWQDSERVRATVSFSVGFSAGPVSVSVGINPGYVASSKTAYFAACPEHLLYTNVQLYVGRCYRITRTAVYRKDNYAGVETFVGYEDNSVANGKQFWIIRA